MFEPDRPQSPNRPLLPTPSPSEQPKQQRLMVTALSLLLLCLGFVLYRDRDFWFPGTEDVAENRAETSTAPAQNATSEAKKIASSPHKARTHGKLNDRPAKPTTTPAENAMPPTTVTRTVLPPLEVEVVAGDTHRRLRPGSNSLKIDMGEQESAQPGQSSTEPSEVPAEVMTNAAGRTAISTDAQEVVTHSVQPGYPMLARQMKVQGAVILQALIGRDGLIQDLHVISGPPILASAAQEAVKQWHFKPHYIGKEAVETQSKITVNFTISTN